MPNAASDNSIMSAAELKPLLLLSKRQPVNCAIGLTKDKQGVILLDKRMKPRKLAAQLKSTAKTKKVELDPNSIRFGKAEVDPDKDSALVTFTVNKDAAAALRPKLLEQLKKAGFSKCEVTVDTTLENEPEDEAAEKGGEGQAAADAGSQDGAAHGGISRAARATSGQPDADAAAGQHEGEPPTADMAGEPAQGADSAPEAEPHAASGQDGAAPKGSADPESTASAPSASEGPDAASEPSAAAGSDAAALTKRLTGLVKRALVSMQSNPAAATQMKAAATAAQAALRSGDLATAGQQADNLETLLGDTKDGANAASGSGGPAMGSAVFSKARDAWIATRAKVQGDLDSVFQEVKATLEGHKASSDMEKAFHDHVGPAMEKLDHSLSAKLDEVVKNGDPAGHGKLVQDSQALISQYMSFLSGEKTFAQLDQNPFHKVETEKTLQTSLTALGKALQVGGSGNGGAGAAGTATAGQNAASRAA